MQFMELGVGHLNSRTLIPSNRNVVQDDSEEEGPADSAHSTSQADGNTDNYSYLEEEDLEDDDMEEDDEMPDTGDLDDAHASDDLDEEDESVSAGGSDDEGLGL